MAVKRGERAGAITGGVILLTLGLLFLSGELGFGDIRSLWRYWPLVLVAIGLGKLAMGEGEERLGGLTELFLGAAFLAITLHWWDLSWGSGWPLLVVAVGAAMVLRSLFAPRPRRPASGAAVVEEERHV